MLVFFFFGKAWFRWAILSCDSSYSFYTNNSFSFIIIFHFHLIILQPKKHKERKKQSAREDVDEEPVPRDHYDVQKEKETQEELGTKWQTEVEKSKEKPTEAAKEIASKVELEPKETVETLDTGQVKSEIENLNTVELAQTDRVEHLETDKGKNDHGTDINTGQRKTEPQTSTDLDTDQPSIRAEKQDGTSEIETIKKIENESLESETFNSFQEVREGKQDQVVKSEIECESNTLGDLSEAEVITDTGTTKETAVIKPCESESKEEHSKTESTDKSNVEATMLQNVVTETEKSDSERTDAVQAVIQGHSKEMVKEDSEVKNESVKAEGESKTENVPEVSEGKPGVAVEQEHIYPDLTKDIGKFKAELEQVGQ